jgi:beta-phosphoglucomutase
MDSKQRFAALWDVDGTLVDTAELHFQSWVRIAAELRKPFTREQFAATFGQRNPEVIRHAFGPHDDVDVARIGERKEGYYRAEAQKGVQLLPGVRELLDAFEQGGFVQVVGSSAPRDNLELILELTNTGRYFQAIVSMEDTTRGKPDPEVFLVAAKKVDIPPNQCVVLEDAVAGVQAAKAAGMKCVAVTFVGHHPGDKLRAAGADRVVKTLRDVNVGDLLKLLGKSD